MTRSGGDGKWWLVFVLACAVGLWWRLHSRGSTDDGATPAPPPAPRPVPPVADARAVETPPLADASVVAEVDAAARRPRDSYISGFQLRRLSTDGKRALLAAGSPALARLRVVAVDTGNVETDLDLAAFAADDLAHDDITVDALARIRTALRGFPLGATVSYATTPDGTAGAYATVDALRVVHGDQLGFTYKTPASYDPLALPDGKTLLLRTYHSHVKDQGVYALGWATLDSPVVHEIDGTVDDTGWWGVSAAGDKLRISVTPIDDPHAVCIVEVPLARPFKVGARRCLDDSSDASFELSPSGEWVVWKTTGGHVRTLNVATGAAGIDVPFDGPSELLVTDTGRAFAQTADATYELTPAPHTLDTAVDLSSCLPRGERELVCEDHGSVTVVKI